MSDLTTPTIHSREFISTTRVVPYKDAIANNNKTAMKKKKQQNTNNKLHVISHKHIQPQDHKCTHVYNIGHASGSVLHKTNRQLHNSRRTENKITILQTDDTQKHSGLVNKNKRTGKRE